MRFIHRYGALILAVCVACAPVFALAAATPLIVDGTGSELAGVAAAAATATNLSTKTTGDTSGQNCGDTGGCAEDEYVSPAKTALPVRWNGQDAALVSMGTVLSVIRVKDGEITVPTREVTYDTKADAGKQLAIVSTPKKGSATLWTKAAKKSVILDRCVTGSVLPVLELTKKYAKVFYNGVEGYVLRSSIHFASPSDIAPSVAVIAYQGNTKSRSTVKVRMNGSAKSRVVGEFPCGTQVTVVAPGDKWTEAEIGGLHCFILTEFLTAPEPLASPTELKSAAE